MKLYFFNTWDKDSFCIELLPSILVTNDSIYLSWLVFGLEIEFGH